MLSKSLSQVFVSVLCLCSRGFKNKTSSLLPLTLSRGFPPPCPMCLESNFLSVIGGIPASQEGLMSQSKAEWLRRPLPAGRPGIQRERVWAGLHMPVHVEDSAVTEDASAAGRRHRVQPAPRPFAEILPHPARGIVAVGVDDHHQSPGVEVVDEELGVAGVDAAYE